jgi:hypothetical protein
MGLLQANGPSKGDEPEEDSNTSGWSSSSWSEDGSLLSDSLSQSGQQAFTDTTSKRSRSNYLLRRPLCRCDDSKDIFKLIKEHFASGFASTESDDQRIHITGGFLHKLEKSFGTTIISGIGPSYIIEISIMCFPSLRRIRLHRN